MVSFPGSGIIWEFLVKLNFVLDCYSLTNLIFSFVLFVSLFLFSNWKDEEANFPPLEIMMFWDKILTFKKLEGEQLNESWMRFKEL